MSLLRRVVCRNSVTVSLINNSQQKSILGNLTRISRIQLSAAATSSDAGNLKQTQTQNGNNKTEWNVIYRLPIIRWASAFNRLKVYQGAISIAGIPATFMLEQAAILPAGTGATFATVGLTGLMTLALCSLIVKNLIGFIYIDRSGNRLKFAYVDYWGRRNEFVVDIQDLVPDGAQEKPTRVNFYQIISAKSNENFKLKLLQRYGVITNGDVFNTLFY